MILALPMLVLSADNLAERLKGKILLAVEDHGKTYYVHEDGYRYRVDKRTAQRIFQNLALGINNENLNKIPEMYVGEEQEDVCEPEIIEITCEPEIIEKLKTVYVDRVVEKTVYVEACNDEPELTGDTTSPLMTYEVPNIHNNFIFSVVTDEPTYKLYTVVATSTFSDIEKAPTTNVHDCLHELTLECNDRWSSVQVDQQYFYKIEATDEAGNKTIIDFHEDNYFIY